MGLREGKKLRQRGQGELDSPAAQETDNVHTLQAPHVSSERLQAPKKDNETNPNKNNVLPGKVFVSRSSMLTDLLLVPHIRTLYNICIVIFILLFFNTVAYDLADTGSINIGLRLVVLAFGKLGSVCVVWGGMQLAALTLPLLVRAWAAGRGRLQGFPRSCWGWLCLLVFLMCQLSLLVLPTVAVVRYELPIASAVIVLTEMTRFVMKVHAFVRSVCPRVLGWRGKGSATAALPPYSCYLYFMFAPTLVYQDSYPRASSRSWRVVLQRLLEVFIIIMYMSFLCERFLILNFAKFGQPGQVLGAEQLVLSVFGSMLPSLLLYVCGHFLLLHSWMNAAAEALHFADRRFYLDWWNQSNYGAFYRTWNLVVHEWLHTYVYREWSSLGGGRLTAQLLVFLVSAVIHEYILGFAFGFFYPVMLVEFGLFGVLLVFLTRGHNSHTGNVLMWLTLAVGNGLLWSLYGMEWFARRNCPPLQPHDGFLAQLLPRSWTCQAVKLKPDWQFTGAVTLEAA